MNSDERELCRFCLEIIQDQNFEVIGDITLKMLNALSIKMNLDVDGRSLMCRNCEDTIDKCFNFKSACIYSEDIIAEYITDDSKLELEKVYLKEILRQSSKVIPRDHKVCRLCMKITAKYLKNTDELFPIANDKLQKCMPELNLNVVTHPVICDACLVALQTYFEFVNNCLDVEKKINKYCEAKTVDKMQVHLYNVLQFIPNKLLESDISKCASPRNMGKLADDQLNNKINCTDFRAVDINSKTKKVEVKLEDDNKGSKTVYKNSEIGLINEDQVQFSKAVQFNQNNINCEKTAYDLDTEEKQEMVPLAKVIKGEDADEKHSQLSKQYNFMPESDVGMYINYGEIEIKLEDVVMSSSNKRINGNSETGVIFGGSIQCPEADQFIKNNINCDKKRYCSDAEDSHYSFLQKISLSTKIKEENEDENQLQVSTKHDFKEGSACVKNEEIEIKSGDADMSYIKDCESQENTLLQVKSCKKKYDEDRRTKNKAFFCEICSTSYASKYTLERHKLLKHVEDLPARIFGCNQCSFITGYSESLSNHKKVHKNGSELNMYKCKECEFRTKYKGNLKAHSLARHQNSEVLVPNKLMLAHSDVKIYSCGLCDYKTKFKKHLEYHEMTHKDKSELATYDCFHCGYKGKRKSHLRTHMKVHDTTRELRIYQSKTCGFISKDMSCVTSDKNQTDVYSCDKSTFIKSQDSSLKNDTLTQTFKCEICLYQATSSTELKQHNFTHPEVKQAHSTTYNWIHC